MQKYVKSTSEGADGSLKIVLRVLEVLKVLGVLRVLGVLGILKVPEFGSLESCLPAGRLELWL